MTGAAWTWLEGEPAAYALTFIQVLLIDLALAGDNALAVGVVAARLDEPARIRRAVTLGIALAVLLRIALAFLALRLLQVTGLTLAGGVVLLWVAWRLAREAGARRRRAEELSRAGGTATIAPRRRASLTVTVALVVLTDLAMSLDNVLAVAGAARGRPIALAVGLGLSALLMIVAAYWIARRLARLSWLGYVAAAVVAVTALSMILDGGREVIGAGALDSFCPCKTSR